MTITSIYSLRTEIIYALPYPKLTTVLTLAKICQRLAAASQPLASPGQAREIPINKSGNPVPSHMLNSQPGPIPSYPIRVRPGSIPPYNFQALSHLVPVPSSMPGLGQDGMGYPRPGGQPSLALQHVYKVSKLSR
jgi:hypothetical protein